MVQATACRRSDGCHRGCVFVEFAVLQMVEAGGDGIRRRAVQLLCELLQNADGGGVVGIAVEQCIARGDGEEDAVGVVADAG